MAGKYVRFAACALAAFAVLHAAPGARRAEAQSEARENPRSFGSELVNKVKKGCIYIWMTDPAYNMGSGIGSGFIFEALPEERAALALTNHHVAGQSGIMQVELWNRETYKAEIIATEPGIDSALIKIYNIDPSAYVPCVLGDSDKVLAGDIGLAVGAPGSEDSYNTNRSDPSISFGLHQTATMRVVAGVATDPMEMLENWAGWKARQGRQVLSNLPYRLNVQTAINGGNSGGPLFNADGEVIGLNHAGYPGGIAVLQNINSAIPINVAKNFAYQILNTGRYEVPWLGLDLLFPAQLLPTGDPGAASQAISEWVDKHYDAAALEVHGVRRKSEAERAGILRGDRIIEFDGQRFDALKDLRKYIFSLPIGKEIPVTLKRGKEVVKVNVSVGVKRGYDAEFSF